MNASTKRGAYSRNAARIKIENLHRGIGIRLLINRDFTNNYAIKRNDKLAKLHTGRILSYRESKFISCHCVWFCLTFYFSIIERFVKFSNIAFDKNDQ